MSPRKPAVLRGADGQNLRGHLIETAARLIGQRGSAGLSVRDIAREAQVADGALYNYFEDKEDLLAHALLAHVGQVMTHGPQLPPPGTGALEDNLRDFIDAGLGTLVRVTPAFAGLMSQPKVLSRFREMIGGDAAFGAAVDEPATAPDPAAAHRPAEDDDFDEQPGLPELLTSYLLAEQELGRIAADADVEAASSLVIGAMHGQIFPRVLFSPADTAITMPPGLSARLARTILSGIASR